MKDGLHRPQITFDRHIQLMTIQVDLYLRDSKWTAYHNPHLLDTINNGIMSGTLFRERVRNAKQLIVTVQDSHCNMEGIVSLANLIPGGVNGHLQSDIDSKGIA